MNLYNEKRILRLRPSMTSHLWTFIVSYSYKLLFAVLRRHHELRNDRVRMANCALAVSSAAVTRYSSRKTFILVVKTTDRRATLSRLRPPDAMSVVPEAVSPESYLTASVKPLQPPHEMSANSEGAVRLIRGDIGREDVRDPYPVNVVSCHVVPASWFVYARYVIIFTRFLAPKISRSLVRSPHSALSPVAQPRMHSRNTLSIPCRCLLATKPMLLSQAPSLLSGISHFLCVTNSSVNY